MANWATIANSGNPLAPNWQQQNLTSIKAPNGQTWQVNKRAADAFQGLIADLYKEGYVPHSSGGFNYRTIRGNPNKLSQHAFGNAIDINADQNPLGSRSNNLPANVADLARTHGLEWGGLWKNRPDPMHFEYVGSSTPGLAGLFTGGAQPGGPSPGLAAATTAAVQDGQRYNTAAPDVAGIAAKIAQANQEANALTPKPNFAGGMATGGLQPAGPEMPYAPDVQNTPLQLRPVALPDASPELGTLGQLLAAQKANLVQAAQVGAAPVDPRAPIRPTGLSALFAPPPAV